MVKEVTAITMPKLMIDRLDIFLKTDLAKGMGFESRPQVFISLLRNFLETMEQQIKSTNTPAFKKYTYDRRIKNYFIIKHEITNEEIRISVDTTGKHRCTACYPLITHCVHIDYILDLENALPEMLVNGAKLPDKYTDLMNYRYFGENSLKKEN